MSWENWGIVTGLLLLLTVIFFFFLEALPHGPETSVTEETESLAPAANREESPGTKRAA